MSWLNIFLVPDYLWLIAENFLSLDATLNLLATCKSIKAAGSDYLWNLRILREVKIRVHDWFMMVAVEICHSLGYHLVRRTRGFDFYAQYLSGLHRDAAEMALSRCRTSQLETCGGYPAGFYCM